MQSWMLVDCGVDKEQSVPIVAYMLTHNPVWMDQHHLQQMWKSG
jgi:hypothetical protein